MSSLRFLAILILSALLTSPCLAESGLPSLTLSTATMSGAGVEILTLMVVPDGSGPGFDEAVDPRGVVADATIELVLRDTSGDPILLFPWEDLWLDTGDPEDGLSGCHGIPNFPERLVADANTDMDGRTHWRVPPLAGGHSAGLTFVMVNGSALVSNGGLPLRFNSPDISGDGKVNLSDVVPFAVDFYGDYHFRSDLAHDGMINLSDVAKMAQHMGASCP